MGMNDTPSADRIHIGFFGRRNAGKSSLLKAVTGQNLAGRSYTKVIKMVPVTKTMELLPLGPVMMIDTPGIDDEGELGSLRVRKSYQMLNKTDVAVLVVDGKTGSMPEDEALFQKIREKKIPCALVLNKLDDEEDGDNGSGRLSSQLPPECPVICASARTGRGVNQLKECLARLGKQEENSKRIVGDLIEPADFIILGVPIDKAVPKGRLILPQQQTIRDILEAGAVSLVVRETELADTLKNLGKKQKLVVTDSQVFGKVAADTPEDILLTSFSILFARYKGNLERLVEGAAVLDEIRDGDKVLICEGCTHHRQCGDIGTEKLPKLKSTPGHSQNLCLPRERNFPMI